ncbi:MAG: hypothetical protein IPJ34_04640 [Myxococcales bacterium]|nr:hypothetical protein [Myxococcales bacterium]
MRAAILIGLLGCGAVETPTVEDVGARDTGAADTSGDADADAAEVDPWACPTALPDLYATCRTGMPTCTYGTCADGQPRQRVCVDGRWVVAFRSC